MALSLRSSNRCYQYTVIQPFELKNTHFHSLKASFHHFPTVIFLDFQSSFQYPNGLIFTILNKPHLFYPYDDVFHIRIHPGSSASDPGCTENRKT